MRDRPHWDGRPTRLPDGGWGVLIQRLPGAPTPQPGDTVKVRTRRRRNWTAKIVAIEEARRITVVRATGPAEPVEPEDLRDSAPPELGSSVKNDPLAALRETADTLHAAAAALRAAQLGGEQAYREVLSTIYYAEDDQGCNLVEAHQVLRSRLPVRNASEHALEGAGRLLESATDTLFGAKDLLEQVAWLDDFGEVKAAGTLRAAIARMDASGLLKAAGDAIREAALLLADPANPNSADLNQEHREEFVTLRKICDALRQVLPNARQDES